MSYDAAYCDPLAESWEWSHEDSWESPKNEKVGRFDLSRVVVRIAEQAPSVKITFDRLVFQWREDTENLSSFTKIVSDVNYQNVIRLGRQDRSIVGLILQDLKQHGGYWATALQAITGDNPVKPENIGNAKKVALDWLEWGRGRGYV